LFAAYSIAAELMSFTKSLEKYLSVFFQYTFGAGCSLIAAAGRLTIKTPGNSNSETNQINGKGSSFCFSLRKCRAGVAVKIMVRGKTSHRPHARRWLRPHKNGALYPHPHQPKTAPTLFFPGPGVRRAD
jgi:hypothetical protein